MRITKSAVEEYHIKRGHSSGDDRVAGGFG